MYHYYLVSTPLHLLISCALAAQTEQKCLLLFIDQYDEQANAYLQGLKQWQDNPFIETLVFTGRDSTGLGKLRLRQQIFTDIEQVVTQYPPSAVHVGNDRRIEFQYLMQYARNQQNLATKGIYIDEGLFTYIGREASRRFAEATIDNLIRKFFYGRWWQTPPTIGASKWIDQIIVAFPKLVHPKLRHKTAEKLLPAVFSNPKLLQLTQLWLADYQREVDLLEKSQVIITLPEKTDMNQVPNYRAEITDFVKTLSQRNYRIAVKYHPSARGSDELKLADLANVFLLPDQVPFEILLPHLDGSAILLGDMSSTLLTTKMIRPEIQSMVIEVSPLDYFAKFRSFYSKLNIETCSPSTILEKMIL